MGNVACIVCMAAKATRVLHWWRQQELGKFSDPWQQRYRVYAAKDQEIWEASARSVHRFAAGRVVTRGLSRHFSPISGIHTDLHEGGGLARQRTLVSTLSVKWNLVFFATFGTSDGQVERHGATPDPLHCPQVSALTSSCAYQC